MPDALVTGIDDETLDRAQSAIEAEAEEIENRLDQGIGNAFSQKRAIVMNELGVTRDYAAEVMTALDVRFAKRVKEAEAARKRVSESVAEIVAPKSEDERIFEDFEAAYAMVDLAAKEVGGAMPSELVFRTVRFGKEIQVSIPWVVVRTFVIPARHVGVRSLGAHIRRNYHRA